MRRALYRIPLPAVYSAGPVVNTDSPLFLHSGEQRHYFLVAGRWFRAPSYAHAVAHVREEFPNATTQRVPAVMSVTSERVR